MTALAPRERITGEDRTALATSMRAAYEAGGTVRNLMAAFGTTYGRTWILLREAGTEMRPRGGAHGR